MLEVFILINDPIMEQDMYDRLMKLISPDKQARIKKFRFPKDAQNCLLGDVLTRIEICRATGLNNIDIEFSVNEYGKQFLVNDPGIHYNISHSGHYIACAISDEPVGIDIEIFKSADLKIAERFFAPDETQYVREANSIYRFYEIWTKKESRIKWEGVGLRKSLTSFSVLNPEELEKLSYHEVFRDNQVICHVCSGIKSKPSVKVINTKTLLEYIR